MEDRQPLIKHGWLRALIYFIGVFVIMLLVTGAGYVLIKQLGITPDANSEGNILNFGIMYTVLGIFIFLFTFLMRRFVDRKSFKSLGFEWKNYKEEASIGFFSALGLLGIGSLILVALGYLTFISINADANAVLIELVIMVVVAFVEELLFRGYILNNLMTSMNKWIALLISAVLFGLVHGTNPGVTVFAVANVFLAGIFLGLNYIFTKNLWFGIFFHFAWNFLQGPILGYEVSGLKLQSMFQQSLTGPDLWTGGPFGFEGSALCPVLLTVSILSLGFGFTRKYATAQAAK
jgi:uncharacterized protein